jgi:RNA polymerase sigma-70 factor, ECF subfamily
MEKSPMDFKEVYREYSPKVYRVCMGYVNDRDQEKDLMQDMFIAVWKNTSTFRQEASIGTWIFRSGLLFFTPLQRG